MIKPFVDSMSASPEGGHALFDRSENDTETEAASASVPQLPGTQLSTSKTSAGQDTTSDIKVPSSVTYSDDTVFVFSYCSTAMQFSSVTYIAASLVFV